MTHVLALALILAAPLAPARTAPTPAAAPTALSAPKGAPAPAATPGAATPAAARTASAPQQPRSWTLATDRSSLTYHVDHKLHHVQATAKTLEGKAVLGADGTLQLMVRAPVTAFDSGDANRDAHMREVMETGKYPFVTLKGVTRIALPATFPATVQATIEAELELHGRRQHERVPVTLELRSPTELRATGALTFSLDRYGIERPALLLVKVEDSCRVDLDVTARVEAR